LIKNSVNKRCRGDRRTIPRVRGRGQAPRVPWLYRAVLYGRAEHSKIRSAAEVYVCI